MHGLDEYDSEARWNQPGIMRTTTIDPSAEKYYSISPYAWCGNNPVNLIDPDGMEYVTSTVINPNGEVIYHKDDNDKNIYFSPDGKLGSDGVFTGLDVVGIEQAGYNYKLGSEIPIGHLTNDGIRIITGWDIKNLEDDDDAYLLMFIFESVYGILSLNPSLGSVHSRNIRGFRAPSRGGILSDKIITAKLQKIVSDVAKRVDAAGDGAFTPAQMDAIKRHPWLRAMFRGYQIDAGVRRLITTNYPELSFLKGKINKGVDFFNPRTGLHWDMTTPQSFPAHQKKYGKDLILLRTQ